MVLGKKKLKFTFIYLKKKAIYSMLGTKNPINYIVDRVSRGSRLPSLTRVLLYLVIVGVSRVSWALRYLDKPKSKRALLRLTLTSNIIILFA